MKLSKLSLVICSLFCASWAIAQDKGSGSDFVVVEDHKSWQLVEYAQEVQFTEPLPPKHTSFYVLKDEEGIVESPLPEMLKQQFLEDLAKDKEENATLNEQLKLTHEESFPQESDEIIIVHTGLAEAIANNDVSTLAKYGRLYNQSLLHNLENSEFPSDQESTAYTDPGQAWFFCGVTRRNYSRSFDAEIPDINHSENFNISNSISGTLELGFQHTASQDPEVEGTIYYQVKRWCGIPYSVKLRRVAFQLRLQADDHSYGLYAQIGASLREISTRLFDLKLARGTIFLGPIPVVYGADLPIDVGIYGRADITADVSAALHGEGFYVLSGDCNSDGCSFSDNADFVFEEAITPEFTSGVEANVRLFPFIRATAIGWLYSQDILSLHLGAQAEAPLWGWGYYGNSCGDANNDNINETVSALTLDIQARIRILGKTRILWNDTLLWFNGNTVWSDHLAFIDFLGDSSALTPIIEANPDNNIYADYAKDFNVRMRPCYPYNNPINYQVQWGDGDVSSFTSNNPRVSSRRSHTWDSPGNYSLTATALEDSIGRNINSTTSYSIEVKDGEPIPAQPQSISFSRQPTGVALPVVDRPEYTESIQIYTFPQFGSPRTLVAEVSVVGNPNNPVTLNIPLNYGQWVQAKACSSSGCSFYSLPVFLSEIP